MFQQFLDFYRKRQSCENLHQTGLRSRAEISVQIYAGWAPDPKCLHGKTHHLFLRGSLEQMAVDRNRETTSEFRSFGL